MGSYVEAGKTLRNQTNIDHSPAHADEQWSIIGSDNSAPAFRGYGIEIL